MGNPTNELRAKLDELGVRWWPDKYYRDTNTCWRVGDFEWRASEKKDGKLLIGCTCVKYLTPEQAIAVTVGAGTCKRVYHPNRITKTCTCSNCGYGASDERWAYCPKCGHKYVHGEVEERWKRAGRKVDE